jgi:hypothetical protein
MIIIPPPKKYHSKILNEFIKTVTPENIDEFEKVFRKMESERREVVVALAIQLHLRALQARRAQYEAAGISPVPEDTVNPCGKGQDVPEESPRVAVPAGEK